MDGFERVKSAKTRAKLENLYNFIKEFTRQNGYPPSVREIGKELDISSTATVFYYINKLDDLGLLKKSDNKSRGIGIVDKYDSYKRDFVQIPLIGQITAGSPILADQNLEDVYSLPEDLFQSGELFMLNVKGDSMINAGILNGDKIVVRSQSTCDNGDIVVALIENEATVKRFYKEKGHIRLQPENDSMEPIIVEDAAVLGLVVGLIRSL